MKELKCPKCGSVFSVDAEIAALKAAVEKNAEEVKLALLEKEKADLQVVAGKDVEIAALKAEIAKKDGETKANLAEKRLRRPNRRFSAARINCALQTIRWMI